MIRTDYLEEVFHVAKFNKTIKSLRESIRRFKIKKPFDTIVFTGVSGAAVGFPLSLQLKIPTLCIRKELSHFGYRPEGNYGVKNFIIVDDFIDSGQTIRYIIRNVTRINLHAKCVGIFLYGYTARRNEFRIERSDNSMTEDIIPIIRLNDKRKCTTPKRKSK